MDEMLTFFNALWRAERDFRRDEMNPG